MPNILPYAMGLQKILSHLFEKDQAHWKMADALQCYSGQVPALIVWPLLYASQNKFKVSVGLDFFDAYESAGFNVSKLTIFDICCMLSV